MKPPVLTIAGSDSIGGAGIQADFKAFALLGVHGMGVITGLTAQNTLAVSAIHAVPARFVRRQLEAVFADIRPAAIKTGMLTNGAIIHTVAQFLAKQGSAIPLVVDPVLAAATGARLLDPQAEEALKRFLSLATLVTPNLAEATALAETPQPTSALAMEVLLQALVKRYPGPAWLIKGGHATWQGDQVVSLLYYAGRIYRLTHPRLTLERPPHGTGCTAAAAIAAGLAHGIPLPQAVEKALQFTYEAIRRANPHLSHGSLLLDPPPDWTLTA